MKRKTIIIIVSILAIMIVTLIISNNEKKELQINFDDGQACIEEKCFIIEKARTENERIKGLSGVEKMKEDEGMLIEFPTSQKHGIWMNKMNFPLDILWISEEGIIVSLWENAKPCKNYCPITTNEEEAKYVLEINSGLAEKNSMFLGKKIDFKY